MSKALVFINTGCRAIIRFGKQPFSKTDKYLTSCKHPFSLQNCGSCAPCWLLQFLANLGGFMVKYSLNMWENLKSKHFFGNDPDPLFRWLKKPVFLKWVRLWVESGLVLLSPLKWVLVGFTAFQLRLRRSRVFELSQLKRASPIINILFSWPAGPSQFWFSAVQPVLIFSCPASFDIQLAS